ncbi:smoothelin-like protein 2 [Megalops cyprinoides]|uniref:smoothelin-like protein 2 n=1 Tax=Megalops cyprinoides TaxID=118141 RepID=UPI001863F385|nr:smoothelin-like protein 2 [Megalops cyprinoides]
MDGGRRTSLGAGALEEEEEAVSATLSRYEATVRDAMREIHVDVEAFKLGLERRLEETAGLTEPLVRAMAELQLENRQLRSRLETLTRQVEMLTGEACDRSALLGIAPFDPVLSWVPGSRPSPGSPTSITHPALSSRTQNLFTPSPQTIPFLSRASISASSKTSSIERDGPTETSSALGPAVLENGHTPGPDKHASAPSKSVTYSSVTSPSSDRVTDMGRETSSGRGVERRRELVRSQTLPHNLGAQAARSLFEKLDSDISRSKPQDSKPKLKRSQSFGVVSASSIKQILLDWCRSKTIGYENIDIQNFSSSWSNGLAFCALVHSFFPTEFDYSTLTPANRKRNFELAFGIAETKAGCDRLIEVEDMMQMGRRPDPMCVFTYVQALYNHLRKFE